MLHLQHGPLDPKNGLPFCLRFNHQQSTYHTNGDKPILWNDKSIHLFFSYFTRSCRPLNRARTSERLLMSLLLDNGQPSGMTAPSPGNKTCRICASQVSGFKASPTEPGHTEKKRNRDGRISAVEVRQHGDDHRACGECWEAHLSLQVQEKHAAEVQCMFCPKVLTASEIGDLSRKDSREL